LNRFRDCFIALQAQNIDALVAQINEHKMIQNRPRSIYTFCGLSLTIWPMRAMKTLMLTAFSTKHSFVNDGVVCSNPYLELISKENYYKIKNHAQLDELNAVLAFIYKYVVVPDDKPEITYFFAQNRVDIQVRNTTERILCTVNFEHGYPDHDLEAFWAKGTKM